jgi:hypothetical protein
MIPDRRRDVIERGGLDKRRGSEHVHMAYTPQRRL